jgi:hypothetical protein
MIERDDHLIAASAQRVLEASMLNSVLHTAQAGAVLTFLPTAARCFTR